MSGSGTPAVWKRFGERLRVARKDRQFSQRRVASEVGIDHTYLSKMKAGTIPLPSSETIAKLADAVRLDPDDLFFAAGWVPPDVLVLVAEAGPHEWQRMRDWYGGPRP